MKNHEGMLIQLDRLRRAVEAERGKLLPGPAPPKPGTADYQDLRIKIAEWRRRAEVIDRSLDSRQALVDLQFNKARFGPRRHAAKQRHASLSANIAKESAACARFALAVARLYRDLHGLPSAAHARGKALEDIIQGVQTDLDADGDGLVSPQELRAVIAELAEGDMPAPMTGTATGALTLAVFLLTLLYERMRR